MQQAKNKKRNISHLKILAGVLTLGGVCLFVYFISQVGIEGIRAGVGRVGFQGFALIFLIYAARLAMRSLAWKLCVEAPYKIRFRDAYAAVVIGEAMSSMIPLGIIISGTSKALAVRHKIPLVAGLSSLAVENLFYSLVTGLFIVFGATQLLLNFDLSAFWATVSNAAIGVIVFLIVAGIIMVVRQWHFASATVEWIYRKGFLRSWLEKWRADVRTFENRIYGFYRHQAKLFLPIIVLQIIFHALGMLEVWLILSFISDIAPTIFSALLLESVSRVIIVIFKLVPFVLGVDEAAAQFITETLQLGAGIGITLAVVRKGARVAWAIIGILLLVKRGFSLREIFRHDHADNSEKEHLSHQTS